jgi:hypothetical protein
LEKENENNRNLQEYENYDLNEDKKMKILKK